MLSKKSYILYLLIIQIFLILLFDQQNISFPFHNNETQHLSQNITHAKTTYHAQIAKRPVFTFNKTMLTLDLKQKTHQEKSEHVHGRVLLTIPETCHITQKSTILFTGAIKEPKHFINPGGFDYKKHLQRQGIWGKAYVPSCKDITIINKTAASLTDGVRQKIFRTIQFSPAKNKDLILQLMLGIRSITQENQIKIQDAGLSHLFAISGTHFGIMCALIFILITKLTEFTPLLYLYISKQKIAALCTLLFVVLYLSILEPRASILRASIMIMLYLIAIIINRQKNLSTIILSAAFIILLFSPFSLYDISFQLSFLCILIITIIYPKLLPRKLKEWLHSQSKMIHVFTHALFLSLTLNIFLTPLILYHFNTASLNGFIHNIWAIPFFQFIMIPLTLLSLCSILLFPSFASFILIIFDQSLILFLKTLMTLNVLSLPIISFYKPHTSHLLLFYIILFLLFIKSKLKIILPLIFLFLFSLGHTFYELHLSYDFKITQIDVGQGDALLIQTRHKNILIDTGGQPFFDIGNNVLLPFLKHSWITHLDLVLLTHDDLDHVGGLSGLLGNIAIGDVWINDTHSKKPFFQKLLAEIRDHNTSIIVKSNYENFFIDNNTSLEVLATAGKKPYKGNNASLVLLMIHKQFRALFTGDIVKTREKDLIQTYDNALKADYLKVSHHGSKTASSSDFLKKVQPKIVSMGVGKQDRFGHPHTQTLTHLTNISSTILRTDQHGACGVVIKKERTTPFRTKE
ncbi:MAG: DNA internalization-related competence protein ComEC/Rec2 [bacterium]|nr:DNA internalization-related competence protein ComEC/Rec2 [bacterium]MBU1918747.1 DNA internalization-related competence protein ComEC/Rec2 [bacterium]